jgi:hypothetical protein
MEKMYQMIIIYSERPYISPNGHKLYQTALKCTNIFLSKALQSTYTQIGNFGLKINHLATLV